MSGAERMAQRDVGEWTNGNEPQAGGVATGVDDEPNGVGPVERCRGRRQIGAVEPALAVHEGTELRFGDEGAVAARVHGHVDLEQVAHHERVVGRAFERRVARHRRDADQVGVAGGGDDGDGVVVARVAVEQDRGLRRHRRSGDGFGSGHPAEHVTCAQTQRDERTAR